MVYIFLMIFLFLIYYISRKKEGDQAQKNKFFLIAFFGACTLVMGFRNYTVGVDSYSYAVIYYNTAEKSLMDIILNSQSSRMETGYAVLMKLCSIIVEDYFFFQFVVSAIYCSCMAKFIYDNSEDVFLSTFLFLGIGLYLQAFGVTRQCLAVAIVINLWTCLKRKKKFWGLVLLLIAMSIHTSAIIFALAFFVFKFRNNRNVMRLLPLAFLIIAANYENVIPMFIEQYEKYNIYSINKSEIVGVGGSTIMWFVLGVLSSYFLYIKKIKYMDCSDEIVLSLLYVIGQFVGLYFSYADRIGLYFMPFVILMLPHVEKFFTSSDIKKIYRVGIIFCFASFYILNATMYEPLTYSTFFG